MVFVSLYVIQAQAGMTTVSMRRIIVGTLAVELVSFGST